MDPDDVLFQIGCAGNWSLILDLNLRRFGRASIVGHSSIAFGLVFYSLLTGPGGVAASQCSVEDLEGAIFDLGQQVARHAVRN